MADSYFLRPSADKGTLGHTCSTGSSGYSLINEETHDSDNGYVYHRCSYTSSSKSSTFLFGEKGENPKVTFTLPEGRMYGDVGSLATQEHDGKFDEHDNEVLNQYLGGYSVTDEQLALLDVNGDGIIDISDLIELAKLIRSDIYHPCSTYKGDYLNNWSFDSTNRLFYYDVTTEHATTSMIAKITSGHDIRYYNFFGKCYNGYIRVYALRLPLYETIIDIEIINKSELISTTLPEGLMYGDIDQDGLITLYDADEVQEHILSGNYLTEELELALADINQDGSVGAKDYKQIKRLAVGGALVENLGDYLGNWSSSTSDQGADFTRRYYYDITNTNSTTSHIAYVICEDEPTTHNAFYAECFNGYIRVHAKSLPLEDLSVYIQLIKVDNSISLTLPEGLAYGDINMNGEIDTNDCLLFKAYLADNSILDEEQVALIDANQDGEINGKDLLLLRRALNGEAGVATSVFSDSLNNWIGATDWGADNSRLFYHDFTNTSITTSTPDEYDIYITTNSDQMVNGYTVECLNHKIRIYAFNLPLASTNLKIHLKKKEVPPLQSVSGVNLHLVARGSSSVTSPSIKCFFSVGSENGGTSAEMGIESSTLTTSYADYSASSAAMATAINNYITANNAFPTISAKLTTSGTSYAQAQIRITQIYVELLYDDVSGGGTTTTALRIKQNGAWTPVTKVYKKVNNSWVEQTDLNSLFNSNTKYIKK